MTGKRRPPAPTKPARPARPAALPDARSEDEARFIQALIARGEAARAVNGVLPDNATHEIVEDEHGRITVVRRRFVG